VVRRVEVGWCGDRMRFFLLGALVIKNGVKVLPSCLPVARQFFTEGAL
jgi:hypothetical protein